jgi:hypothetical protein
MRTVTYPAKYTFFPPLSTLQLPHSVLERSLSPRPLVCWHGRNPTVVSCSPSDGLSSSARTSHQSSSVQLSRPARVNLECRNQLAGHAVTAAHSAANHCLSPSGTKKWMLGCSSWSFFMVLWSVWS